MCWTVEPTEMYRQRKSTCNHDRLEWIGKTLHIFVSYVKRNNSQVEAKQLIRQQFSMAALRLYRKWHDEVEVNS